MAQDIGGPGNFGKLMVSYTITRPALAQVLNLLLVITTKRSSSLSAPTVLDAYGERVR